MHGENYSVLSVNSIKQNDIENERKMSKQLVERSRALDMRINPLRSQTIWITNWELQLHWQYSFSPDCTRSIPGRSKLLAVELVKVL